MNKTLIAIGLGLVASLYALPPAVATVIEFETMALGGNNYRHTYTVTNNTLGAPLQLFDIAFDPALYAESTLTIVTPASLQAEWDENFFPSDAILALPAIYDVFALGAGLATGGIATGFAVEFQWLGAGLPGNQIFQVYDYDVASGGVTLLETGTTSSRNAPPNPMPEPGTLWTLLLGAVALIGARLKSSPYRG